MAPSFVSYLPCLLPPAFFCYYFFSLVRDFLLGGVTFLISLLNGGGGGDTLRWSYETQPSLRSSRHINNTVRCERGGKGGWCDGRGSRALTRFPFSQSLSSSTPSAIHRPSSLPTPTPKAPPTLAPSAVEEPPDEGPDLVLVEAAVVEEEEGGVSALLRLLRLVPVVGDDAVVRVGFGRLGRLCVWTWALSSLWCARRKGGDS